MTKLKGARTMRVRDRVRMRKQLIRIAIVRIDEVIAELKRQRIHLINVMKEMEQ